MKTLKIFFCMLLITIINTSFMSVDDKKPKGRLILEGQIKTNTFFPLKGKIKFFLEKENNDEIKSISIGGTLLGFSSIGTFDINSRKKDTLKISKDIDKHITVILNSLFNKHGGNINLILNTHEGIKKESFYIRKNKDNEFIIYNDSLYTDKTKTLNVLFSFKKGILKYNKDPKKSY